MSDVTNIDRSTPSTKRWKRGGQRTCLTIVPMGSTDLWHYMCSYHGMDAHSRQLLNLTRANCVAVSVRSLLPCIRFFRHNVWLSVELGVVMVSRQSLTYGDTTSVNSCISKETRGLVATGRHDTQVDKLRGAGP